MPDRIPAPTDIGDLDKLVLPARACLMSIGDVLGPARRPALQDSIRNARQIAKRSDSDDRSNAAALAAMWECVACLELAATVAAPWVDPQLDSENGAWVEMTRYDGGRANRFYESSHKWSDERFGVLSGHRLRHGASDSLLDAIRSIRRSTRPSTAGSSRSISHIT